MSQPKPRTKHPNTVAAGGTLITGAFVVWLLGQLGVGISAEAGVAIAGTMTVLVLFVGRNGLKGTWERLWGGKKHEPPART